MTTRTATATLFSASPYSASKKVFEERTPEESADDFEKRTWRQKLHTDRKTGLVVLPGMAFKWALASAAQRMQIKIPGKGKSTYTKNFLSGVLPGGDMPLNIKPEDVPSTPVYVNADGKRGSGSRVTRYFPTIHEWRGTIDFLVIDYEIKEDVFNRVLAEAGNFIGIGQFRPQNGGWCGRFQVESVAWS